MRNENEKGGVRVLTVLEMLLFLSPGKESSANKYPAQLNTVPSESSPDDIKNQILLKIERAEIMSAMVAMRKEKQDENKEVASIDR